MIVALMLLSGVLGCEATTGDEKFNSGEGNGENRKVKVMLDWYPNAVHSFLYVAEENGYFEEEGIEVDVLYPTNPTDPIQLAATGEITLGITYQPDVIMARAKDIPVKAVAAIVPQPLNHIVYLDGSLQSPADLEGKTVGYPGIPVNEPLLNTMVEASGGDPAKVNLIDVGFDLGAALVSAQVDAVIGAYINHEVPVLKYQGHDVHYFDPVEFGVPPYYELVMVTNDTTWEKQKEQIQSFWRAAQKGYQWVRKNPEKGLDILFAHQEQGNFPLIREVEEESLSILLSKMERDPEKFGIQREEDWQRTTQWLLEAGLIDHVPSIEKMFVNLIE